MAGPKPENPDQSPLMLFREGLEQGGLAISPEATPARRFPPRLAVGLPLTPVNRDYPLRNGTVYSATRIETRAGRFTMALIDLDGGGRLLARLRGEEPAPAMIGRRVALVGEREEGEPALTFAPEVAAETRDLP